MRKTLAYVIAERFSSGNIKFHHALKYIFKYKKYFYLSDFLLIVIKMFAKKIIRNGFR